MCDDENIGEKMANGQIESPQIKKLETANEKIGNHKWNNWKSTNEEIWNPQMKKLETKNEKSKKS